MVSSSSAGQRSLPPPALSEFCGIANLMGLDQRPNITSQFGAASVYYLLEVPHGHTFPQPRRLGQGG